MNPAAVPPGVWPPADVDLAARIFPERQDADASFLDRWAQSGYLAASHAKLLRRRAERRFLQTVDAAEPAMQGCTDDELRAAARAGATAAFASRDPVAGARALAALREVAVRALGLRPHPPQILGAWTMVRGCLIELDTGEGKTLTAAMAASFAALAGVPTHVVTVNDYLAQRDAEIMSPLFRFLALSVGVVHSGVAQPDRAGQYAQSLTYCTNKDLVFDYLRDRVNGKGLHSMGQMAVRRLHGDLHLAEALRLRGLHFAIVDEADSVLIDEARTPLILSAMRDATADAAVYGVLLDVARSLEAGTDYRLEPGPSVELTPRGLRRLADLAEERRHESDFTPGQPGLNLPAEHDPAAEVWRTPWILEHYVLQALRALHLFKRDQHYVVAEGKIVIVDEFTGRMLPDRSWEAGLHQLVEAKEGCTPTGSNVTLARITYQAFFGRYLRLAGMSGTIREMAGEMASVFAQPCVRIEPNRPSRRIELSPLLMRSQAAKAQAVVDEVRAMTARGRAVLVGTRSVRASLELSQALTEAGVLHRVLNARQNADEAELVAAAGEPGAVTVATNMAGRGTDIRLAPEVAEHGGLHVVLTEWHESSRIDRQLYGRCARQGDPGSVRAIVALDDEVIERHGRHAAALLARLHPQGRAPAWAVQGLRRVVQQAAESANARQRSQTLRQDRLLRGQLAFSGGGE